MKTTAKCPICGGSYDVHGASGAKPISSAFPNVLIARSNCHWMLNVWLRGADGKTVWVDSIADRNLNTYLQGLNHARKLNQMGGLMPTESEK